MGRRMTIEQLQRRWDEVYLSGRGLSICAVREPTDGEVLIRSTQGMGCLVHRTRYINESLAEWRPDHLGVSFHTECGAQFTEVEPVAVGDAITMCSKCYAACEKWELGTFGLLPDTGCSASGGRWFRPRNLWPDAQEPPDR